MGFKGDVPRVFLACVLHASGTNPAAVRGFRRRFSKAMAIELFSSDVLRVFQACVLHASKAMCRDRHVFFLWVSKVTFREFFWLVFCMLRARILLLFEAFAGSFPRPCAVRNMFFMDSKGDVPRVFQGAFAGGFPRPCAVIDMFFMDSKGDVPRVFSGLCSACFDHESCCCSRLSEAVFQGSFPRPCVVMFREFFRLVFCMLRARILLLFEAFAGGFPRPCAVRDMFFIYGFQT